MCVPLLFSLGIYFSLSQEKRNIIFKSKHSLIIDVISISTMLLLLCGICDIKISKFIICSLWVCFFAENTKF